MTNYKVTVQFLRDFKITAESPEEAREKARKAGIDSLAGGGSSETSVIGETRLYAQEPKNLDLPKKEPKKK